MDVFMIKNKVKTIKSKKDLKDFLKKQGFSKINFKLNFKNLFKNFIGLPYEEIILIENSVGLQGRIEIKCIDDDILEYYLVEINGISLLKDYLV